MTSWRFLYYHWSVYSRKKIQSRDCDQHSRRSCKTWSWEMMRWPAAISPDPAKPFFSIPIEFPWIQMAGSVKSTGCYLRLWMCACECECPGTDGPGQATFIGNLLKNATERDSGNPRRYSFFPATFTSLREIWAAPAFPPGTRLRIGFCTEKKTFVHRLVWG